MNSKSVQTESPLKKVEFKFIYIVGISLISALGGFLFGYDWVVIGGAKPFYEAYFDLTSSFEIGWAMSSALVGCLIGAALSGYITDKYGRKKVLIFSGLLFTLSAVSTALSETFSLFIWARILGGVGIGLASNVSPMYIAEIAPAKYRGRLVSLNQLTIVLGILAAQIANWLIAETVPGDATHSYLLNSWNGQYGWRWMFGVEAIPAFIFFGMAWFVPESPRWLVKQNLTDKARQVLQKIGGPTYANNKLIAVKETLEKEDQKVSVSELWKPSLLPILAIGVGLAVFQQWSGINVIFNYAEEVFTSAGYTITDMLFNIIVTGTINLIFTLVAMQTVDKWGRKKLMLIGAGGLSVTYLLLAFFYYTQILGIHMLILVVTAIALYAMSLAPVTWVIISEIFPNRIRGAAMSVSVFALWAASLVLTYTFPILNQGLGEGPKGTAFTFCVYAGICVLGFILIYAKLPETKGKSLEELEQELIQE
ncbi:sugar porter family MFS transporter [Aliifodinibius sp. S!AR15-10]|uniref:sugar porter family MFS transporter n=1 Tax=Aliifodinibius sp. S!AR15-10 TaxID=2950437 RepID=UPI00286631E1|nr:sugar porter family MFS transporter [Aliifodinibius sp. S!AR15-10]MDR8389529.1 sugar porter family MFS transporter [Aliifodinibius sp. S!AR15-10]